MRKWLIVPSSMAVSALLVVAGAAAAATAGASAHAPALTWSVVQSPNRELARGATVNSLDAVSCASTSACTAVGSYLNGLGAQRTLAESWDGARWLVLHSPNRGRASKGNALFRASSGINKNWEGRAEFVPPAGRTPSPGEPTKLTWSWWDTFEYQVPFEFRNLPLP